MFAYPTMVLKVLTVAAERRAQIGNILNILEAIDIMFLKRMLNLTIIDNKIRGKDAIQCVQKRREEWNSYIARMAEIDKIRIYLQERNIDVPKKLSNVLVEIY